MTKSKKKRIHRDRTKDININPKIRNLVNCDCTLRCNGGKWVDRRTFEKHQREMDQIRKIVSESSQSKSTKISESSNSSQSKNTKSKKRRKKKRKVEATESRTSSNGESNSNGESGSNGESNSDVNPETDQELPITKKRKRYNKFVERILAEEDEEDEKPVYEDFIEDEDFTDAEDDNQNENDETPVEQFTAPNLEESSEPKPETDDNVNKNENSWMLLWIFKFQSRFRLPDTATDSLIKFIRMVLTDANCKMSEDFPTSAYMARNLLGIGKLEKGYAVCLSCNALYNNTKISANQNDQAFTRSKCTHVEFLNHPIKSKRNPCGSELLKKVPVNNGYVWRPNITYPLIPLKIQLLSMFQRQGFEEQLRKWTNRDVGNESMSDIYDGRIWKTFPSSLEDPNSRFFTPETADSNLGIMINLDWFQPFESSEYSTGAIYGVICNLPRDVRFKKENMLTLGLLPGPKEVKKHRMNHFLAPIVDELLELWNGYDLPVSNGKRIRVAVICCSSDIPAARKLCGHISALAACHRCYKRASRNSDDTGKKVRKVNYGGFEDMDYWFRERDLNEHRQNAKEWRKCRSDDERRRHVSTTLARWSEMLRLPYFNPIRHLVVDPMHCLFLGISHWIIKRLWIDNKKLSKTDLEIIEKRANDMKLPADLGRIPNKISVGEGFSGFKADQWKNFTLIYAIPLLWDRLDDSDREILNNFVRACSLLVCRTIDDSALNEAHFRLLSAALLIEKNYGKELITPNIHLSLHISECCRDYGPLYTFWCFSFERMNGILGKIFIPIN